MRGRRFLRSPGNRCSPGDGFDPVVREALTKLGVAWEPSTAKVAYNEGRSTQVPMNPVVRVRDRFARKLRYKSMELAFE